MCRHEKQKLYGILLEHVKMQKKIFIGLVSVSFIFCYVITSIPPRLLTMRITVGLSIYWDKDKQGTLSQFL